MLQDLRRLLAVLGAVGLVVAGLLVPATAAQAATYALLVSGSPDRSAAVPLGGTTQGGSVYVFLSPSQGVTKTVFKLDGVKVRTDTSGPMDLAGGSASAARPYDTATLSDGSHTLQATVTDASGTSRVSATFTVTNGAATVTGPSYSLQVSARPDHGGAVPLDGTTQAGDVYVFTAPDDGVTRVVFSVDGVVSRTENVAPFDLAGGDPGAATPYSTTRLADGPHTITADITDGSGTTRVGAAFTVANTTGGGTGGTGGTGGGGTTTTYSLLVSPSPDRAGAVPLDGTTQRGAVYVFTSPDAGVTKVVFSVDGAVSRTENVAPFDLAGGSAAAADPYRTTALSDGPHTVSAAVTDGAGTSKVSATFRVDNAPPPPGTRVVLSSPDDVALGLPATRLVFSTVNGAATPAKAYTITNTTTAPITVRDLAVSGPDAADWALAPGQPTSVDLAPGAAAQVKLVFLPRPPSDCYAGSSVANYDRYAVLTFSTSDPAQPAGQADLAGLNPCKVEGGWEPSADQMVRVLGYSTSLHPGTANLRGFGAMRTPTSADEVFAPYFVRADASAPARLTTVARYQGRYTFQEPSGWFPKGGYTATPSTSCSSCQYLFKHPGDTSTAYVENQKLMPAIVDGGTTTFSPPGAFGLFEGQGYQVNFSDDAKNYAQDSSGAPITSPGSIYLHNYRVYKAYYGASRTPVPDTYLLLDDIGRIAGNQNGDYQDYVSVLRNVRPELTPARASASTSFPAGGTVGADCSITSPTGTGMDGVLPSSGAVACDPSRLRLDGNGLTVTATPGEMGGSKNAQQNALFDRFDASTGAFTVRTRIAGPVDYLTQNYQQAAAWFGPDQDNYVKVEVEHNNDSVPHVSMFFEERGSGTVVQTVPVPALTTASTVDLIIKGNPSVYNLDATYGAKGKPLDELTVFYSIDGGTPVQVGEVRRPADVMRWFSSRAQAGLLASGGGSGTTITPTFRVFAVTRG